MSLPSAALILHILTKTDLWRDSPVADCGTIIWETQWLRLESLLLKTLLCGSLPPPQDLRSFLLPLLHWSVSLVERCDVDIPFRAEYFRNSQWLGGMNRTCARSSQTKHSGVGQGGFSECLISGHIIRLHQSVTFLTLGRPVPHSKVSKFHFLSMFAHDV